MARRDRGGAHVPWADTACLSVTYNYVPFLPTGSSPRDGVSCTALRRTSGWPPALQVTSLRRKGARTCRGQHGVPLGALPDLKDSGSPQRTSHSSRPVRGLSCPDILRQRHLPQDDGVVGPMRVSSVVTATVPPPSFLQNQQWALHAGLVDTTPHQPWRLGWQATLWLRRVIALFDVVSPQRGSCSASQWALPTGETDVCQLPAPPTCQPPRSLLVRTVCMDSPVPRTCP